MSEHTKEPWEALPEVEEAGEESEEFVVYDSDGLMVCLASKSNARRIVACVNACAGIPTENLERNADMTRSMFDDAIKDVEQQRDKLLEALKMLAKQCAIDIGVPYEDCIGGRFESVRALIAEVEATK